MKKGLQEEESNAVINVQQDVVPVKRKRGRPPLKNKNQNPPSENRKIQRAIEIQNEETPIEFIYPPQIPFTGFDLDQNLKVASLSTNFFRNIIDKILGLWWNGSSPVFCDDSKIIKYELVFNMFRFMKYLFGSIPPFLIVSNTEHMNQWLSTFIEYKSYIFTDSENDSNSEMFYTNKSKSKLDVLVLSNEQDLSNFSLSHFSLLILDQPANFDNFSYFDNHDIKSCFLICNSSTENIPSTFDFENNISVTLDDMKNNRFVSETLHFCPMTQFQILQTQQLFKSNKSRLSQNLGPQSERLTMFLSHMVKQVKSISVHPSLSTNFSTPVDDQSGKFQELLKIVTNLQKGENKISIIGQDPQLLKFTASYFIKNRINAYNVNQLLKGKKKIQLIEEFNQSDSSSVLLIDPENFFEFHSRLIIDKIIILEVDISLDSMIDEILDWQQSQHDNTPQIIRLITDNSIELPIYEMQFNSLSKEDEKENQFYDIDKMESETLLLLLKQSASLCFTFEGEEIRKQMEVCYSHSPSKLFQIKTEFHQNFWNDITQIEMHQDGANQKKNKEKQPKQQSNTKTIDNPDDKSSIATRAKKEFIRKARFSDQEKQQKTEKVKTKAPTRYTSKKSLDNEIDNDNYEFLTKKQKPSKTKKTATKYRKSPRLNKPRKYKDLDSNSDDDDIESESDDSETDYESESEYDYEYEKKEIESFNEEEEEENDNQEQEESENENQIEMKDLESDDNDSIAARKKKRLLRKQLLEKKMQEKALKKAPKSKKLKKRVKISKSSQKTTQSTDKKTTEQQQIQQQNLQKPRKHIPKFDSLVAYWNPKNFAQYLELLHDFGFDRWDKFSAFERPIQEYRKIGALIIRNLDTTSRENRLLREYFKNELRSSELSRLDNALPFVRRKLTAMINSNKMNRNDFLADLTGMLLITKLEPKSPDDIVLPKACSEIEPLDAEWTKDDDKMLIYLIYENGLFHIPTTFKHALSKGFIKRYRSFFVVDPSDMTSANIVSLTSGSASLPKTTPVIINESKQTNSMSIAKSVAMKKKSLTTESSIKAKNQFDDGPTVTRSSRKIGLKLHISIIRTLCSYGYPGIEKFKDQMSNLGNVSVSDLEDYVETIFNFSICTSKEERKVLAMKLAGKIEKYTATKIISRKNMFDKIRKDAFDYDGISAEDIELLSAMAFHGFLNTETSPVLLSSCGGECSDQRLFQRVKAITMQEQIHNEEPISVFIKQSQQQQQNDETKEEEENQNEIPIFLRKIQENKENIINQETNAEKIENNDQSQSYQTIETIKLDDQSENGFSESPQINNQAQLNLQESGFSESSQINNQVQLNLQESDLSESNQINNQTQFDLQERGLSESNQINNQTQFDLLERGLSESNQINNQKQLNLLESGLSESNQIQLNQQEGSWNESIQINEQNQASEPTELLDQSNQENQEQNTFNQSITTNEKDQEDNSLSFEESLFPLKLNDRQVLKSIGTIDPRFHDENYIYPVGYECAVACINPFNDNQNLIWLNLSVRQLNTKIDKADKSNNDGDFLIFVAQKEREKSAEISDESPERVFEKIRQRIMRKSRNWIPPFDGNEMFGFNSSKVHRILSEMPNFDLCTNYRRRFFRLPMQIDHEWPILGRYDDKKKQLQMYTMFTSGENLNQGKDAHSADLLLTQLPPSLKSASVSLNKKIKNIKKLNQKAPKEKLKAEKSQFSLMKKKEFGNLLKPLVINCKPIFNSDLENASVSVSGSSIRLGELMKRYQKWDQDIIQKYIPQFSIGNDQ